MINIFENNCKQFLVLTQAREVIARNQLSGAEVGIELREGEILLNPGDLGFKHVDLKEDMACNIKYIREITRIKKNVKFDEIEVVEGGKVIFNARLIKDIEFKLTYNAVCPEFSGIIGFKVVEIPFSGYIEIKGANPGDIVKLEGFIEGELDRPPVGIPFVGVNEIGGEEEPRLIHKLPGAIILLEKTIVKVCGEVCAKKEICK